LSKLSRIIVVAALAVLAASVVSRFTTSNSHAEFIGNLTASVGPGFEIQLKTADGALVSSVAAGTYAIHVNDSASNHNFHLEGTGVSMATGIDAIEEVDWTVDFTDGYYTYHCDRHPSLTATFAAGNAQPIAVPTPVAPPAPAPVPIPVPPVASAPSAPTITLPPVVKTTTSRPAGTLTVTLSAKGALTVTKSGKAVRKLVKGTYNVVVFDKSKKRDLTLRRIGGATKLLTGRSFTGKKKLSIDLTGGQWKLYSAVNEQGVFAFFKVTKS
jgi:plastocyanin